MNDEIVDKLTQAFGGLFDEELERLKYHQEKGTRVLVGTEGSRTFTDGKGGG